MKKRVPTAARGEHSIRRTFGSRFAADPDYRQCLLMVPTLLAITISAIAKFEFPGPAAWATGFMIATLCLGFGAIATFSIRYGNASVSHTLRNSSTIYRNRSPVAFWLHVGVCLALPVGLICYLSILLFKP